jgi:three-Cys-motif partner protein
LKWPVIALAGQLGTIDLFLNFPIMDMNRNALWSRPEGVDAEDLTRMTAWWGDDSWRSAAYRPSRQENLFGSADVEKQPNDAIVEAFRNRLRDVASFRYVPQPIPMRNRLGATVYYLFFASQNETANRIASHILEKFGKRA